MNHSEEILEAQLRECFGRVVYSHKTHEKCADILLSRLSTIKVWQIALSAITTGGFLSTFFGSGEIGAGIGVVISTALLVLNAYTKNYDLGELAQKHRGAAADLWLIREQYLTLLTDLRGASQSLTEIMSARNTLLKDLHAVYTGAPSTTFQAYKKAQEALQRFEDLTFSDSEIDAFLPSELKKANKTLHPTAGNAPI
jgi:hypothetical protein